MLNKVMLIGYVGRDPDVRYTQTGQAVANFSIATSQKWNDRDGKKQERTEWHKIVAWGAVVENYIAKYVHKGDRLCVEGKLQTREWEDKKGEKRYTTEIVAMQVIGLGGGSGERSSDRDEGPKEYQGPAPEPTSDDIPF